MLSINSKLVLSSAALCFALSAQPAMAGTQFPADAQSAYGSGKSCVLTNAEFADWKTLPQYTGTLPTFYDETSGLVYVFPVDGPSFAGTSPCDYYKWGSRMFLWLTSTLTDITTQASPTASPGPDADYVFAAEFFYGVEDIINSTGIERDKMLVAQGTGALTSIASSHIKGNDAKSTAQPGSDGVLMSQGANNVSKNNSLVYYGMHTNRMFGYFLNENGTTTKSFPSTSAESCATLNYAMNNPKPVAKGTYASNSAISDLLYLLYCSGLDKQASQANAGLTAAPALSISDLEPGIDYLSMIMEIKTAWVEADTLNNPENYIRQYGMVPEYSIVKSKWGPTGVVKKKKLALVGMHVVGTVNGHEEMIWATFEHNDNAPNHDYQYLSTSGATKTVVETTATSNGDWLFSDGTCVDNASLKSEGSKAKSDTPVNVNRISPWGNKNSSACAAPASATATAKSKLTAADNALLISLNSSINAMLKSEQPSDPRANYFLSGAVYTSDGKVPTSGKDKNIVGSKWLANTTLETFTQDKGCFGCHYTSKTDPTGVSHIFGSLNTTLPKASNK